MHTVIVTKIRICVYFDFIAFFIPAIAVSLSSPASGSSQVALTPTVQPLFPPPHRSIRALPFQK